MIELDDYESISVEIISTSDRAIFCQIEGFDVWVPRSVIEGGEDITEFSEISELSVKSWFLEKEGLV